MTFKHGKFEDSAVLRSLEKLSLDKGLIKEDILEKIASSKVSKLDLSPTENLNENLIKLCIGLRDAGLDKYANDLESLFVLYKKAEVCKCDEIIDEAHPKGSHKIDGIEGDAVIETIIDQQLEDLKIVNKKPTGKLTTASQIINAAKSMLKSAQPIMTEQEITYRKKLAFEKIPPILSLLERAKVIVNNTMQDTFFYKRIFNKNYSEIKNTINRLNASNINDENVQSIIDDLTDIFVWDDKERKDNRDQVASLMSNGISLAKSALSIIKGETTVALPALSEVETLAKNVLVKKFESQKQDLMNKMKGQLNKEFPESVINWLSKQIIYVSKLENIPENISKLELAKKHFSDFESKWGK